MARKAEWEKLRERSAERFGEDSVFGEGNLGSPSFRVSANEILIRPPEQAYRRR